MKLLKCKICMGEVDIISEECTIIKKIKCRKCHFSNEITSPEVIVLRKRKKDFD